MTPKLSDEAWELLSALHRAAHGGPPPPSGWVVTYNELHSHGWWFLSAPVVKSPLRASAR